MWMHEDLLRILIRRSQSARNRLLVVVELICAEMGSMR